MLLQRLTVVQRPLPISTATDLRQGVHFQCKRRICIRHLRAVLPARAARGSSDAEILALTIL